MTEKKYHLNNKTGKVSVCEATVKECPLGVDNHFNSAEEARVFYEKSKKDGSLNGLKKITPAERMRNIKRSLVQVSERIDEANRIIKQREKNEKDFVGSDEWFSLIQKRKELVYVLEEIKKAEFDSMSSEERLNKLKMLNQEGYLMHSEKVIRAEEEGDWLSVYYFDGENSKFLTGTVAYFDNTEIVLQDDTDARLHSLEFKDIITSRVKKMSAKPFNYHPNIEGNAHKKNVNEILKAAYNLDDKVIAKEISERKEKGMSQTEAYRDLWNSSSFRTDKSFVALDLETAGIRTQKVDTGPYSTIIEVGYVKLDGDNISHNSEFHGVPKSLMNSHGTGAQNVHGITPEMVKDKKEFSKNIEAQEKLLNDLKGNVLIAHNAKFEVQQLSHNLIGFKTAYDNGEIEVLDTKNVSQYFLPSAANNTNENFVKATGGEYTNAHRAYSDAVMSLNALRRMKNLPEIEGQE